jgi:hypothetical protein
MQIFVHARLVCDFIAKEDFGCLKQDTINRDFIQLMKVKQANLIFNWFNDKYACRGDAGLTGRCYFHTFHAIIE